MTGGMSENRSGKAETQQQNVSGDHDATGSGPRKSRSSSGILSVLTNLLSVAAIVYFTYYFSVFFSVQPPEPPQIPESVRTATKKTEELHAQERRILTTYGYSNPALKRVRIPVDRAMELIVAESSAPSAAPSPPVVSAPAPVVSPPQPVVALPQPGTTSPTATSTVGVKPTTAVPNPPQIPAPIPAVVAAAAPAAPVGMPPDILYRAICITCHDVDGKGGLVRKAMPAIPDFTDPKWHVTRSDAELQHSIMEGKGQLMLPMKDKFVLAKADPKSMVAFVRSFQPGGAPTATPPTPTPSATPNTTVVASAPAPAPTVVASASPATVSPVTPAAVAPTVPAPVSSSSAALATAAPLPPEVAALFAPPAPPVIPPRTRPSAAGGAEHSAETEAKLRASAEVYRTNCLACHGPDGRGGLVRIAMPAIPDFTARAWQTTRETPQLSISILDGKGTLMPPWRSKLTLEQARDLAVYVRNFGPADLLTAEITPTQFGNRFRDLKKQWDELEQQARSLPHP